MDVTAKRRLCERCNRWRRLHHFDRHKGRTDGVKVICRECCAHKAGPKQFERYRFDAYLRRTYDISLDERDAILREQGGRCAICRRRIFYTSGGESSHVDHDHATGRIRGVLCPNCNWCLEEAVDRGQYPEFVTAVAAYLSDPPARRVGLDRRAVGRRAD